MKILFIGGTGVISTEITKRCAASGWDVTLLNRGQKNGRLPEGLNIKNVHLNIQDEPAVAEWLKDKYFDAVANFINFVPADAERDVRLFTGKTNQYIFISSASAYQKPLSHYIITESTPLSNPYWEYSRNKIACEEIYMDAYRNAGFPITVVRPSHTYDIYSLPVGLHGANGAWQVIKRIQMGKRIIVQGDGSSLWTLTHSQDFARGFCGLIGNIHAIGETVNITSDETLTWNQIYAAIGRALGVEPKLYPVSSDFLCACEPSFAGPLLGDKSVSVVFDNRKLKRLVPGFNAKIRFDTGVRWSLEYMLSHPEARKDDPAFDIFTEKVIYAVETAKENFLREL
jgi:nucleoside-diphosphate-sugar epimerase